MSEDEMRRLENEDQGDEVEGHLRRGPAAGDEGESTEGDEDFEAHRARAGHVNKGA